MKATKYLSLAALALMGTLASCQSDDEAANSFARPANAVGINVTVGSLQTTRSNPASTDPDEAHLFNLGDQVCVSTEGQDPVLFQCQDADQQTWAEAVSGKFLLWKQSEMTFSAYYPATEGTSMTAFNLPADQSSTEKIAQADYMTRQQTCNNESGTDIYLNLERKTARVIVRIAGFNDQYFNNQKTVSNVSIYSEASGIANGNPTGSSTEIQPYAQGDGGQGSTYTALVVPGWGDSGATFVTLTDGENNNLSVKGIPELEAGNSYTFNLTVGKNRIEVASVTVQDWTTGTTLAGGQATEKAVPSSLSELKTAINNSEDCSGYLGWQVNSNGDIAESNVSGTLIGYVGYVSTSDVDTGVSGSRILVLASADASTGAAWGSYGTSRSLTTDGMTGYSYTNTLQGYGSSDHPAAYAAWTYSATIPSGGATPAHWFLPTKDQLSAIVSALGGYSTFKTMVGWSTAPYWLSTEANRNSAWCLTDSGTWLNTGGKNFSGYVRSCFAY